MKEFIYLFCFLFSAFLALPLPAAADTIPIDTMTKLQLIGNDSGYPLSGVTYVLTADIDATGVDFSPIRKLGGISGESSRGIFDGNFHRIRNLRIIRPGDAYVGLFSELSEYSNVQNLMLDNVTIEGGYATGGVAGYSGVLVGTASGTIQNCAVSGKVSGTEAVGGLVGSNSGIVSRCFSSAAVSGTDKVGGLIGSHDNYASVDESFSTGTVRGDSSVGGFIGYNYSQLGCCAKLYWCYSAGRVYGTTDTGAFFGHNDDTNWTNYCYWNSSINPGMPGTGYGGTYGFTGLSASDMKYSSNFYSFNFTSTWCITEGVTYPQLQWASSYIAPQDDTYSVSKYSTLRGNLFENDNSPAGIFSLTNPAAGTLQVSDNGSFTYTPQDNWWQNQLTFSYATGGCGNPAATVTINVHDCTFEISSDCATFSPVGGSGTVTITPSGERCPWELSHNYVDGITLDAESGAGPATVGFTVEKNTGPERIFGVMVYDSRSGNNAQVAITQQSGCTYSVQPDSVTMPNAEGSRAFFVEASATGCGWTAESDNATWLTPNPTQNTWGTGYVYVSVTENTGPDRTGHITVAGKTITVAQRDYATQIASLADLQKIGTALPRDGMYTLAANIDGAGAEIVPIGTCAEPFTGTLTGYSNYATHKISNVHITRPGDDCVGLFGALSSASLSSLQLDNVTVQGNDKTGIFAGYAEHSNITSIAATGSVAGHDHVGGLIGQLEHTGWEYVYGCSISATVTGNNFAGGLLGSDDGSTIMYSTSRASVNATGDYAGVFAGALSGSQAHDIYSRGDVKGKNFVGGFAGFIGAQAKLSISSSTGTVSGASEVGGFAGAITGLASLNNCYGEGAVSGTGSLGGFAGSADNSTITNTYGAGSISGAAPPQAGGFAGSLSQMQSVSGNYWDNGTSPLAAGVGSGDETGIAAEPTAQMRQGATFAGWDFSSTWCIIENSSYPLLKSHSQSIAVHNDAYSVSAYDTLKVAAPGVLANDFNPEAAAKVITNPAHGTLDLKENGSFEYQPAPGYTGADSFVYMAGGCSTATVSLTVKLCHFALQPAQAQFSKTGGSGSVAITADVGACLWDAQASAAWVLVTSPNNSAGSGALTYTVDANSGPSRQATITLGDATFTIIQYSPEIATVADLQIIGSTYPLDGDYELSGDIDATGTNFQPIGDCSHPFTGSFNGNGHAIHHLQIDKPGTDCVGLFGAVQDADIRNIALDGASVSGLLKVGGIAGSALHSAISGCSFSGSVTGYQNTGGIAGTSDNSTVSACSSSGAGSISASNYVGGIAGRNQNSAVIDSCNSTIIVTGPSYVGSLGGLVGVSDNAAISNSSSSGAVTGGSSSYTVGGFAGSTANNSRITNCRSTGPVTGYMYTGGFIGANDHSTISLSSASGNVTAANSSISSNIGGFAGNNSQGTIDSCSAAGAVTNFFGNGGGLVGDNNGGVIAASFSAGPVTGQYQVGGLVGNNENSAEVRNSYSTGEVQALNHVGGLIGYNLSATVTNCYSTGRVLQDASAWSWGGLTGYCSGGITASYWNTETSGQTEGCFGTCPGAYGRTTAEMKQQGAFSSWDFTGTWCMIENATYPQLVWHSAQVVPADDTYAVSAYGELTVTAPGVLANDSTGFGLAAIPVSPPSHGVLQLSADGSFTYTPAQGYSGADGFTYSSGGCRTAAVAITVTPCSFTIAPEQKNFAAAGGSGAISITASDSACPWTAAKSDSWITITSALSGSGSATVQYEVAANSGAARSGTITVAGKTCTITQDVFFSTTTTTTATPYSTTTSIAGGSITTTSTSIGGESTTTTTVSGPCPAAQVLGEDNPTLENLRTFRDDMLAKSALGRRIINIYYSNTDSINDALERSPALRDLTRRVLELIAPAAEKKKEE